MALRTSCCGSEDWTDCEDGYLCGDCGSFIFDLYDEHASYESDDDDELEF